MWGICILVLIQNEYKFINQMPKHIIFMDYISFVFILLKKSKVRIMVDI